MNFTPQMLREIEKREMLEDEQKRQYEQRTDQLAKIGAVLYDKAVMYTNVIIVAGYAAFFAVWNTMKTHLSAREMLLSAFLITLSLICFIAWETTKMIMTSRSFRKLDKLLRETTVESFDTEFERYQGAENRQKITSAKLWVVQLCLTVPSGLLAGAVLIYSFARQLLADFAIIGS